MKIFIPAHDSPKTGKGFFCRRLYDALKSKIEVVSDKNIPHDISLHLISLSKCSSRKNVIRLDGVYHDSAINWKARNNTIRRDLHASDGVIYQSEFSKNICDHYLSAYKGPKTVIPNGADPDFFLPIRPFQKRTKHLFFTSSRWRPHKRLTDIIKSFLLADIPDSVLYVAGDLKQADLDKKDKSLKDSRVHYVGTLSQEQSAAYLKSADAFVHLCWFDNCPNAVVESIAAGTPVITNNVGGTHEIVKASGGTICNIDAQYDFKPVRLYSPPKIDRKIVAQAMLNNANDRPVIRSDHVNIHSVAQKYLHFFREIYGD